MPPTQRQPSKPSTYRTPLVVFGMCQSIQAGRWDGGEDEAANGHLEPSGVALDCRHQDAAGACCGLATLATFVASSECFCTLSAVKAALVGTPRHLSVVPAVLAWT